MKLIKLVWNVVLSLNGRRSGVVVVKLPRGNRAVVLDTALDIDHTSRTKVGPSEFLFPRPDEFDRLAGSFCQTRGLDRAFTGVFATVTRARIRNYDPNFIFRNVKCFRQFSAHSKGPLRSGPDRELVAVPISDGGARLKRRVRDVCHGVGLLELFVRGCQTIGNRSLRTGAATAAFTTTASLA